jgi:predicted tellurium resistance membrane protein TerC
MSFLMIFAQPEAWASLLTLTALEIVLGIDNILFVALVCQKLPPEKRNKARKLGLTLAIGTRLALLFSLFWMSRLTSVAFTLFGHSFSWRDLVLTAGGLFLIYKSTTEIHSEIERKGDDDGSGAGTASFVSVVGQIIVLDAVFSLDTVMTALGMADQVTIMAMAIICAVAIMIWASGPVANFVNRHPTVRILALCFLLLVGMTLVADGSGYPVPKGFIYAAIAFSSLVEGLNQIARRRSEGAE